MLVYKNNWAQNNKYKQRYIGGTEDSFKDRIIEHIGCIDTWKYTSSNLNTAKYICI